MVEAEASLDDLISLRGKRALITRSAAGIGKAIASRFAEAGAALDPADIDQARLDASGDELLSLGGSVKVHTLDVSDREQPWGHRNRGHQRRWQRFATRSVQAD